MAGTKIGRLQIDTLTEIEHRFVEKAFLFGDLTHDDARRNQDWLGSEFINQETLQLGMAFQAFVIRTGKLNILVDSCNGNDKQRPTALWQHNLRSGAFMANLNAMGLTPEDIDIVLCTHLHCDHVGWNTRLVNGKWVPTFPNARYVMNRAEYDYFAAKYATEDSLKVNNGAFEDSVLPVVEAGQSELVSDDHRVFHELGDEIILKSSPGHSLGHVCIHARSGQYEAVICGDVVHHPVQFDMPKLVMRADLDPVLASQTRQALMEYCCETDALLLAGHIPKMSIGRVKRHGSVYRLAAHNG